MNFFNISNNFGSLFDFPVTPINLSSKINKWNSINISRFAPRIFHFLPILKRLQLHQHQNTIKFPHLDYSQLSSPPPIKSIYRIDNNLPSLQPTVANQSSFLMNMNSFKEILMTFSAIILSLKMILNWPVLIKRGGFKWKNATNLKK